MGSKSSPQPSGNTTTTTNSAPWGPQQPYLQSIFGSAQNLYNGGGPQYYPGQTYAPPDQGFNNAISQLENNGLGSYAQGANDFDQSLMNGNYLNYNPATYLLDQFAQNNPGTNNSGFGTLEALAGGGTGLGQSGGQTLQTLANLGNSNAAYANPAYGSLSELSQAGPNLQASGNVLTNQAYGGGANQPTIGTLQNIAAGPGNGVALGGGARNTLSGIAQGNYAGSNLTNGGAGDLSGYAQGNFGTGIGSAQNQLNQFGTQGFGTGIGAAQNQLNQFGTQGFGTGIGSAQNQLNQFGTQGFGTGIGQATNTLQNIANGGVPIGNGARNELQGFATGPNAENNAGNLGAQSLGQFASGAMSGNPVTGALAQSVLSSVLPSIQSQFINGGSLSSPGAAYASAQGAAAGLAPTEFQQWQQEMANQLNAGSTLNSGFLQGQGLQQSAATAQGQQAVASANARANAAQAAGQLGLGKAGLQSQDIQAAGQLGLGKAGLQSQDIQAAGQLGLGKAGLQSQNIQAAGQLGATKAGLENQAASTLGSLGVNLGQLESGAAANQGGLALNAANTQANAATSAAQLAAQQQQIQQQAALGLGNLNLGGAGLQSQTGLGLGGQLLTGQGQQTNALTQALASALGLGGLQYNAGNALGQQTISGAGQQINAAGGLGNIYNQGLQNMVQGLALAPQTEQASLLGPQAALQGSQYAQQAQQAAINDLVQRYNYGQTLPYNALNQFIGQITGNYGGTTTLNQPFYTSPGANAAATGLGALTVGNTLFNPSSGMFPGALGALASFLPFA